MIGTWPLVGRERACSQIADLLASGSPRALAVCGPAGIGKSRLVDEVVAASGPGVWRVRASTALQGAPLAAFSLVVPEIVTGAGDRRTLVSACLDAIAAAPPVAVWVDDAHHLDSESAAVLFHMTDRSLAPVILTVRDGEPVPAGVESLLTLAGADILRVEALEPDQVDALLAAVLGGPVARPSLRALVRRSGGNPLLLRELVRVGLSSGALEERDGLWHNVEGRSAPQGLEDLVADHALGVGPVAATAFRHLALADRLERPAADLISGREVVVELIDAGLVAADDEGTVRPAHPLFAEVVVSTMSVSERRQVRERLADVVEASSPSAADEERVVRWRLDAGVPVAPDRLTAVAWVALSRFDLDLAIAAAQAAVDAGEAVASVPLASALSFAGRPEEAAPVFDVAMEVTTDPFARGFAGLSRTLNRAYIGGFDRSIAEAHRALAEEVEDPGMREVLRSEEASALAFAGHLDEAVDLAAPLVLDPAVDPMVALPYVPAFASARTAQGRTGAVIEPLARLEATVPDLPGRARAWLFAFRAQAEAMHGEFDRAEAAMTRFDDLAYLAIVDDVAAVLSTEMRGLIGMWRGDLDRANRWLGEAVALSSVPESRFRRVVPWGLLAQARALAGDAGGAAEAAAEAEVAAAMLPLGAGHAAQARGWRRYADGDLTGAARTAGEASDWCAARGLGAAALWCAHDALRFSPSLLAAQRVTARAAGIEGRWQAAFSAHAIGVADHRPDALMVAADLFGAMGAQLHASEVLALAANEFRSAGSRDPARRAAVAADAALAACTGLPPRSSGENPEFLLAASLTAREREAALLAAEGLSNVEIAERLGLARRTAEGHLARAMAKLDVSRRTDLAGRLGVTVGVDAPPDA